MRQTCLRGPALLAAVALLCLSCTEVPTDPQLQTPPDGPALRYTVHIDSMPTDTVRVTVRINRWESGDSVRMIAPPMYADNPMPPQSGRNVHNITLRDESGAAVAFSADSMQFGLYRSLVLTAPIRLPMTLEYDVTFGYQPWYGLPLPYVGERGGYLQGTYLFAAPYDGTGGLAHIWRRPWDMHLEYELGDSLYLRGDPSDGAGIRNVYELFFSTSVLGGDVVISGSGGVQDFQFVNIQDTTYGDSMLTAIESGFADIMSDVTGLFGSLGGRPMTVIMGVNKGGGLEGMYAFSIYNPSAADVDGLFHVVAAHEAIHSWIGVRVGDYDDPWWKEGTTNYLGFVVAARNGLCSRRLLEQTMLADLGDSADVRQFALSDAAVRSRLFAPENDMVDLVYVKGAQVCMLMDRRIREASGWSLGLDDVLGAFAREYDGAAFSRGAYLSYISSSTGADLTQLFARYVDSSGAIADSVLSAELAALYAAGVFERAYTIAGTSRQAPSCAIVSKW